jgi:hypothetical protein
MSYHSGDRQPCARHWHGVGDWSLQPRGWLSDRSRPKPPSDAVGRAAHTNRFPRAQIGIQDRVLLRVSSCWRLSFWYGTGVLLLARAVASIRPRQTNSRAFSGVTARRVAEITARRPVLVPWLRSGCAFQRSPDRSFFVVKAWSTACYQERNNALNRSAIRQDDRHGQWKRPPSLPQREGGRRHEPPGCNPVSARSEQPSRTRRADAQTVSMSA